MKEGARTVARPPPGYAVVIVNIHFVIVGYRSLPARVRAASLGGVTVIDRDIRLTPGINKVPGCLYV